MQTTRTPPQRRPSDTGTTPPAPATAGQKMYSAAAIVAAAFVASRILGLVREVIIAARFGTSGEYDAYVAAFKIPDLLFQMVMAGAFGSAFVPVFTGYLGQGQVRKAWRLASNVITIAVEAALVLAVVLFVVAGPVVRLTVARGLPPADQALAVEMTRILLLSPIFLGLGAAAKGILESTGNFTNPALDLSSYSMTSIAAGTFDHYLTSFATAVASTRLPVGATRFRVARTVLIATELPWSWSSCPTWSRSVSFSPMLT